jgi:hypothetical protein
MCPQTYSNGVWFVWSILHPATCWVKVGTYDKQLDANEMRDWLRITQPAGTYIVSERSIDPNDVF